MTTPEALNALADRVEREGPSRTLNVAIWEALNRGVDSKKWIEFGDFTTSLDSAVTLVPAPASWGVGASGCATVTLLCWRFLVSDDVEYHAIGRTPAAALTAAALRARAAMERT